MSPIRRLLTELLHQELKPPKLYQYQDIPFANITITELQLDDLRRRLDSDRR